MEEAGSSSAPSRKRIFGVVVEVVAFGETNPTSYAPTREAA